MNIDPKNPPSVHEMFKDGWRHAFKPDEPPAEGSVQKQECERFFMSGFRACLLVQLHLIATIPEEKGIVILDRWIDELETYFETPKEERGN
jgi:hypothetical protein